MIWKATKTATLVTFCLAGVVLVAGAGLGGVVVALTWLGLPPPMAAFVTVFGLVFIVVFTAMIVDR